ncbi:TRP-like ion channel Pkd2 [Perkinsus chesapeaki]|uniref:TRP-like ion channel Pkd2 n=1 Tax=Perkinsus chesapeaki TaxID=330153 RepID=A0A7J6LKG1_PERCH|nr:TRP-like ion channel Pkd2 [Perkinsus chesapeaki]
MDPHRRTARPRGSFRGGTVRATSRQQDAAAAARELKRRAREASTRMRIRAAILLVMFLVFMVTFTVTVLASLDQTTVNLTQHLRDKFLAGGLLKGIRDEPSFWKYIRRGLREALYPETIDSQMAKDLVGSTSGTAMVPIDVDDWMFGSPRLRQHRVTASQNCEGGSMFSLWTITCFGEFSGSNIQKEPYGVELLDGNGLPITVADVLALGRGESVTRASNNFKTDEEVRREEIDGRYIWFEYEDIGTDGAGTSTSLPDHKGKYGTYPPGGYVLQLPTNADDYDRRTELLEIARFVDLSTRVVFIEASIWNNNLGLFAVVLVAIEFSASGLVATDVDVTVLQPRLFLTPEGLGSIQEWIATFGEIVIVMFILYYVAEEASELATSRWKYFRDPWNILDWITLVFLISAFATRLKIYSSTPLALITYTTQPLTSINLGVEINTYAPATLDFAVLELQDANVYTDLQQIAIDVRFAKQMYALAAISISVKVTKFLASLPYIKLLVKSLHGAYEQFGAFFILFVTTLIGFVMAFNVAFGTSIGELSTFGQALLFLVRGFLKDVDLSRIYAEGPVVGSIAVLLFVAIMYFLMANLLFAIIVANHEEGRDDNEDDEKDEVQGSLAQLKSWFMTKFEVKRRLKLYAPRLYMKIFHKSGDKRSPSKDASPEKAEEPLELTVDAADAMQDSGEFDMEQALADLRLSDDPAVRRRLALRVSRHLITSAEDIMPSIEHMAGRALSKVQAIGIGVSSGMGECLEVVEGLQRAADNITERVEELRAQQIEAIGEE